MTLDVILANGELHRGDSIMVCGLKGTPIITHIRAILTPPVMTEFRLKKSEYTQHDKVRAAVGCKIDAPGLEDAVAGSPLFVIKPTDSEETIEGYSKEVVKSLNLLRGKVDKSGQGVYVQTSSLGSMEALLEYLGSDACKVPVGGIRIGPVHKKDVTKASIMLEHQREFACILAFDVPIAKEIREYADSLGVRIFEDEIIYHLFDMFTVYIEEIRNSEKKLAKEIAVFPCICSILPDCVFRQKSPIIVGIHIEEGVVRKSTPICVPTKNGIELGQIVSIEKDHIQLEEARAGEDVCIEIRQSEDKQQYSWERHFTAEDKLVSKISRESINALVAHFPDLCEKKEIYRLLKKLKAIFGIP